jgi:hypothetical protein
MNNLMSSNQNNQVTLKEALKQEYKKCLLSPVYFMKKYIKIQHAIRGTIPFNLYPFQEKTLQDFYDNDFNIVLKSRQMGISTLVAAYSLWLMLFHSDKNILVISTKQEVAKELVSKVRFANDNLPNWLKIQCLEDNKLSLKFKNGSRILATSAAGDAGRSFALSLLVMDEAAFIDGVDEIWTAAYPTLSTGGRTIILSTPNGVGNFFHKMWKDSEAKRNKFNCIKLPWHLHPERNQEWRDAQTDIAKSPKEAAQECDCDFLTSGATLVDLSTIEWYKECVQRDPVECRGVDRSLWVWEYPDYSRTYIVSADVSRGDGGDYSACHVLDAETLNQCAEYKGQIDLVSFGHMLVNIATEYNKALLIVENTGIGFGTIQTIIDSGYPNMFYTSVDLKYVELQKQIVTKYYSEEKKMVPGFSTTIRTRPLIISRLEQYFRDKAVNIYSSRTLGELETFIWDKGKVVAMNGYNDDLCMSLGIGLWVRDTALRLRSESIDYSRAMTNGMRKSEYTGSSAVFTNKSSNSGYESWNMKVGKSNQRENLHWLL